MAKRIVLFSLLAMPLMAFGQWRVGILGGQTVNFRSASTHYMEHWEYRPLAGDILLNILGNVGIMGQYDVWQSKLTTKGQSWRLGVRAELDWVQKNYSLEKFFMYGHSLSDTGKKTLAGRDTHYNDYLTLPLMGALSWGWTKWRMMVNLGPYVAYWLHGKEEGYISLNGKDLEYDGNYSFNKERDQRWDYGIALGIGLEWNFCQNYAVQAEARCYRSMQSTTKDYMATIKAPHYDTTLAFKFGLIYLF